MSFTFDRSIRALVCVLLVGAMLALCGCERIGKPDTPTEPPETEPPVQTQPPVIDPVVKRNGYVSAIPYGGGFLACGSGGRLDRIDMDGQITNIDLGTTENLLRIWTDDRLILVSGEGGTFLESTDSAYSFHPVDCGAGSGTIYAAVAYEGMRYAAGEGGIVYRENVGGWEAVQMSTQSDIIDLITTNTCIAAITAETDTMVSPDGLNWREENFNQVYAGLYPTYVFTRAVGAGGTFFVLGYELDHPNVPFLMFTEGGEVWMHKAMLKINGQEVTGEEDLRIHDLCFYYDQIYGPMDNGEVLAITTCITCNETKVLEGAGHLWATAAQETGVLMCGENFFAQVLDAKQIRQDKIGAEQALEDVTYGNAVLIDVREADELAEDGYIPGSIHVPLAEVAQRLPELVPDLETEIIFYCASGKRSQTATEQAVDMGYYSVYNLGGLSDWPYEIVKD